MPNPYYNPAECGLEILETVDEPGMSYEFNMFVVWKRLSDGALFYASDSGCSCPSPFEDESAETLTPITAGDSYRSFTDEFNAWRKPSWRDSEPFVSNAETQELFDKVTQALKETAAQ